MKPFVSTIVFVAIIALVLPLAEAAEPTTFEVDRAHSKVLFKVRHRGISTVTGQFKQFDATIDVDPEDLSTLKIRATIDVASVDTEVERRDNHLRSADFFDAENHPKMEFVSTRAEVVGDNQVKLHGDLTIRGVTKPVVLDTVSGGAGDGVSEDGVRIGITAQRGNTRVTSGSSLKVLEGSPGVIQTGKAFPFIYEPYYDTETTTFIPAETGLEATATVLGDGKVQLDLRPVAGRADETGRLRYTEAATSLIVAPGETVVFANVSRDTTDESVGLDGGSKSSLRQNQVLLISVEVEQP